MNHPALQPADTNSLLSMIDAGMEDSLRRLFEILRLPSVGTDPAYHSACRETAKHLRELLAELGFECVLHETTGQPVVLGTRRARTSNKPHVLFYGHYDVQPADPVDLWTSPPFEPVIRKNQSGEDCIYARGAADDKGQFMTFMESVRAFLAVHGELPFSLTVLLEGDEEGDDIHIDRFLKEQRGKLKPDIVFICDTGLWSFDQPAIITQLRGCISCEIEVTGPRIDLHSGYYGGPASNPLKALSSVLAKIHDKNGRVNIPGFYDGVKSPSPSTRKKWAELGFNARRYLGQVGLSQPAGEKGFSALEQMWARPTAEINGIWGGYTGPGGKTVLPSKANAKLTFRIVKGQKPSQLQRGFKAFAKANLPGDCKVKVWATSGDNRAVQVASDSPWLRLASRALCDEWGKAPALAGEGASIPVVQSFQKHLGVDSLLIGFGLDSDSVHSPDENYHVRSFQKGIRSWARIISAFSASREIA